jgi:RND family efflux transporter MFP subunit
MGVISARVRGAVGEMKVHVGDRVAKGDVIAKLVSDTLQSQRELKQAELVEYTARVRTARAQVALAKQELNRLQRLKRSAAFSQARFEDKRQDVTRQASVLAEANAKVDQAQAELKMANIDLAYATIRAPFSGVVSKRHTDVGAYLGVGNPVVTLINDHALEVEAEVPSIRLRGLDEGTVVTVEFEDGRTFKATVRAIVPEENPLARTRTVRFSADLGGNGDRVAVNQSARLIIPTGPTRELVTVHKDAILQRGGGPVVYVIESNQAKMRPVKLGQAFGGRFEVREGLKPGEMVVVRGNERLRPGQRVRIRPGGSS